MKNIGYPTKGHFRDFHFGNKTFRYYQIICQNPGNPPFVRLYEKNGYKAHQRVLVEMPNQTNATTNMLTKTKLGTRVEIHTLSNSKFGTMSIMRVDSNGYFIKTIKNIRGQSLHITGRIKEGVLKKVFGGRNCPKAICENTAQKAIRVLKAIKRKV